MASSQSSAKHVLDCQCLHSIFFGNGVIDRKKLIKILMSRNREEMILIRQTYRTLYNLDIVQHLHNVQLNNNLAMIAYFQISEPHERDSTLLRGALFSFHPNINLVIEILCTRSSIELRSVKQTYQTLYSSSLDQDIALRTQGNKAEILRAILSGSRINGGRTDMGMAMCDAKVIFEAIESGKSVDWKTVLTMISQRSCEQLRAVCHSYRQLYGHEFSKSLKQAKCGEFGRELHCVVKAVQSPDKFFCKQLRLALGNSSAHESVILRTIATRSGIDIIDIKKVFYAKTGWSMESLVRSEFGTVNDDKNCSTISAILVELLAH